MDANDLALLERLGYEGVLAEMAKGDGSLGRSGSQLREEIEYWLRLKEAEIALTSSSKRDAREEETLAIAKEANAIARSQSAARLACGSVCHVRSNYCHCRRNNFNGKSIIMTHN